VTDLQDSEWYSSHANTTKAKNVQHHKHLTNMFLMHWNFAAFTSAMNAI
jgi:hypothetical protein